MIPYTVNHQSHIVYSCPIDDSVSMEDASRLATLCAEHYFRHHDGWDRTWPLTITVLDPMTHDVQQAFSIAIVMVPSFMAVPLAALKTS